MRSFTVLLGLILVFGFSVFAQKGKIEIIETGAFHGDEISAKTGENWLGLLKQNGNYTLLPVVITVVNVHDPIVDESESEKTGKEVKILGQENAVFLIRGGNFTQSREGGRVLRAVRRSRCVHHGRRIANSPRTPDS